MEKQVLGIAQMQNLKELGVDTSKASMVLIYYDDNGEEVGWDVEDHGNGAPLFETYDSECEQWNSARPEYLDAETGNYDNSYREECGVFTLQDMIELIPKEVSYYTLSLYIDRPTISYDDLSDPLNDLSGFTFHGDSEYSLLDLSFEMLFALAEKGYIKAN